MTDFENTIKREMTQKKFEEIRDHVYGDGKNTYGYTYGLVSSWITWNRNENGEIAKKTPPNPKEWKFGHVYDGTIDDWDQKKLSSKLTTDIVFLGLNLAGIGQPKFLHPFSNARGHRRVYKTFFNTEAEGGYFTDIIKPDKRFLNNVGKPADSKEFMKIVRSKPDVLKEHTELFKQELDHIGAKKPLLIIFGSDAHWILEQGLDGNFLNARFNKIIEIWHYSAQNVGTDEEYINDTRDKLAGYITIPLSNNENISRPVNTDKKPKIITATPKTKSPNTGMNNMDRLHEIRNYFIEHGYNLQQPHKGFSGTSVPIGFVVHITQKKSYLKLYNENEAYNEQWFIDNWPALKKLCPDSEIHETLNGRYWFQIPLTHMPSAIDIHEIVKKTKGIMGF